MKIAVLLLAVCAVGQSLDFKHLYPFDPESDLQVPKGDSSSSTLLRLEWPIIFYDNTFDAVAVHTDGFITMEVFDKLGENIKEAILAPFMSDLDGTAVGNIYYKEHTDKHTRKRASHDIRQAFSESASDFEAKSVFVVTWVKLQSENHVGANFTFQCVVASDGTSSFAMFLYPDDELGVGGVEGTRDELSARVGFNDRGREKLEVLSANELLEGGNTRTSGEWIFQIGGVMLGMVGYYEPVHHVKEESTLYRRESGFEVSEVNFNEDYNIGATADCSALECDSEHARCAAYRDGYCCQCKEGYFGNGAVCIENENPVRFNGHVTGYSILMTDTSWSNETANSVDLHSYVVTKDGRAFSVMNGEISASLQRSLQPMLIFGSTLGWIFARASPPAINGFQFTGGMITSDTYIRYTSQLYDFRIRQEYDQIVDDESGGGQVLNGKMAFSGRLPIITAGQRVEIDDYNQIYTKTGPGSIRTRDTRSYRVDGVEYSYTIDQSIRFDGCEASFQEVPEKLVVEVSEVYTEFFETESNLRYAMNNHVRPAEGFARPDDETSIGVRPTDDRVEVPTELPGIEVVPDEPEEPEVIEVVPPESQTVCERQYAEAQRLSEDPYVADEIFIPTCTDIGTFAPRQCTAYDSVCWCVDADTGVEISGTRTRPQVGYTLDCSDVRPPPPQKTPCEEDRAKAEFTRRRAGSAATSIYMPRCMESGAYEPIQQLPDGSFMCVDFRGLELSRSVEKPECMTPCQKQAYIAETSNIFKETSYFVIQCLPNGDFRSKQCVQLYCYCVDNNGIEIPGSRVETGGPGVLDCDDFTQPDYDRPIVVPAIPVVPETTAPPEIHQQPVPEVAQLIFAQSMGINVIDLPVTRENAVARRLFARSDQTAVALAYDCAKKIFYWTDVSKRAIYSSDIDGRGSRTVFANSRIRSPEGIAVDFLSGNVYWTDSDNDRIEVARADGSNRMTLVNTEMTNPRGIAVDPFRGRMYWTDWNRKAPKIWMANMDGTNKRVLVSNDLELPNDITIDFYRQRLCFVDAGTYRVECMSLDGEGREIVYEWSKTPRQHPFGLAIDGDVLFYSAWGGSKVIHAVNWRTGDKVTIAGPRGAHGQMYGVEIVHSQCPRGYNNCVNNNGGCSHLCMPTPAGHVCKCPPSAVDCQ